MEGRGQSRARRDCVMLSLVGGGCKRKGKWRRADREWRKESKSSAEDEE